MAKNRDIPILLGNEIKREKNFPSKKMYKKKGEKKRKETKSRINLRGLVDSSGDYFTPTTRWPPRAWEIINTLDGTIGHH